MRAASASRASFTSVTTTRRAPTWRHTAAAMQPMGPAPVMSTSSPVTSNSSAVCTALPSGSRIEAISSGMKSGSGRTLSAGMTSRSAKAPGRFTPTPLVFAQICACPRWQLRQCPQGMCPSPDTRWPTARPLTPGPRRSIVPAYSWPTIIGAGTVACAQASHFQMCRSVPQIDALRTRISASPGPGSGSGASVRVRPGPPGSLTSALTGSLPAAARRRRRRPPPCRDPRWNAPRTSAFGCGPGRAAPPGRRRP